MPPSDLFSHFEMLLKQAMHGIRGT